MNIREDYIKSVRYRYLLCAIDHYQAMALLMIEGMTPVQSDRFLRSLPWK